MEQTRKKIAILGGSFDPPTIAHIQIAAEVYNYFEDISEVWLIPCGNGRGDKKLRTDGIHRLEMLRLIVSDLIYEAVPIVVNDYEIITNKYWPTYDLIQQLKKENPEVDFVFVCGTDILDSIRTWEFGEELCQEIEFIICKRLNYTPSQKNYPKNYRILDEFIDASSTKIRNRIDEQLKIKKKLDLGISGLTTKSVIKYIQEFKLYSLKNCHEKLDGVEGQIANNGNKDFKGENNANANGN